MSYIHSFPFFTIVMCMVAGVVSSALPRKIAKILCYSVMGLVLIMSLALLVYCVQSGEVFTYTMGQFEAPFGNELRVSSLEALMAMVFATIMVLSLVSGNAYMEREVVVSKQNLYYILVNLLMSSLLALVYTNDLFTAYVFVEINTISACGLIMIRQNGRTFEAAMRYMIMSLLGSGLFLLGISILYDCTGHLLMSNIQENVTILLSEGMYQIPLLVAISFMATGIAIKTALYPFHSWLPDAYGYSTVASSAILSSLVSKGYLFLLIKIFYRIIGFEAVNKTGIMNVFFIFGLIGIIQGSINAIRENDIRRMVSYSSVAQIGYIYMGFGLGSEIGMIASIFHIIAHGATKSLLFLSAIGLTDVSGHSRKFIDLTGAGYRNKIAGIAFTVGSLAMVGIPMFSGFISKLLFSQAAIYAEEKMLITLMVLATSTILNAIYFMKTVIRIYTPIQTDYIKIRFRDQKVYAFGLLLLIILNIMIGMLSQPVVDIIDLGLDYFA
ncbi:MAG: proton-conducting transporter membrane subunit [Eubacteriales bacterium]